MEDFVNKKNHKINQLREEKEKKEVADCHFAPKIYTRKNGDAVQRRNFEQFIQDQRRFIDNVK